MRVSISAQTLVWILAATLAAALVWQLQVANRAPLTWDESVRVDAGAALANAIKGGDFLGLWSWIHAQLYYPFLGPALNGLVLLASNNTLAAAWVPSLAAFATAGILAGRLASELGSGELGAWCAALVTWSAPIFARVSGGAWLEPIGACLLLALVIALVHVERDDGWQAPAAAGVCASLCWFLKYDYGLLALGTIGLSGITAVALSATRATRLSHLAFYGRGRRRRQSQALARAVRQYGEAIAVAAGPIGAWFLVDGSAKLHVILQLFGHVAPGTSSQIDPGYYVTALFAGGEVGLDPLIATFCIVCVLSAVLQVNRREIRVPLLCLGLWYLMYSLAGWRIPRYMGTIMPLVAVFAGLAAGQLVARTHFQSPRLRRVVVAVTSVVVTGQLVLQAAAGTTGLPAQFWFLRADPSAVASLEFASSTLRPDAGAVLMLGQTSELSSYAVHLAWTQRLGRLAPPVDFIGETGQAVSRQSLIDAIDGIGAHQVIGVDVGTGSTFDTLDYRTASPSQPKYMALAHELESTGVLTPVATLYLEGGRLTVTVWNYAHP